MAGIQDVQPMAVADQSHSLAKMTNLAGAAVSLALIVGIGVWGYKLLVRDVSGVPVVRAAEGPMREQPKDPGGQEALNQGLAVNNVAAEGSAEAPADRLILAPAPIELSLEDKPIRETAALEPAEPNELTPLAEKGEPLSAVDQAVRLAALDTLADEIASGQAILENDATAPQVEATVVKAVVVTGGIGQSLRPQVRPARVIKASLPVENGAGWNDVDPSAIPVGTRLAQLGAYESVDVAKAEWNNHLQRFSEYLEGKDRVIQRANSGGRTFYRLRVMGFEDLSDARRFCSALVAENAECIPVVTR